MLKKLFLAAAFTLSVAGVGAQTDFTVNGIKYSVNQDGQSVTIAVQDSATVPSVVNIPSEVSDGVNTYEVTTLAGGAFLGCTNLTSVTLPSTLVEIGTKTINPQDFNSAITTTQYTGSGAFAGCTNLTTANLSACQFTETKGAMFAGCTALTSVSMPSTLTKLTGYDFLICSSLRTLNLTNCTGLTEIGDYTCFQQTAGDGVQYVYVPTTLTTIGNSAFYKNDLRKITDLGTASTPTSAQVSAYPYLTATSDISNVSHLANVSSLGDYAFGSNYSLHAMVLGSASLNSIPESCFASAFDLRWIILSDNITTIDDYAFKGLGNLHSMANTSGDVKVVSYTSLTTNNLLRLPTSLTEIGKNTFKACSAITTMKYEAVDAPKLWRDVLDIMSLHYYEYYSFDLNQAITMYVPECATGYASSGSIITNSSQQCWGYFTDITISKTLSCPDSSDGLSAPNINRVMAKSSSSSSPVYYKGIPFELDETNKTAKVLQLSLYSQTTEAVAAADETGAYTKNTTSTMQIGNQTVTFSVAKYYGEVVVPEKITVEDVEYTVTSIAKDAFISEYCMTAIKLPSSITEIEDGSENKPYVTDIIDDEAGNSQFQYWPETGNSCLFAQCYALKKAVINANVTKLGGFCFADCYLLKDVTLPATLTQLDAGVFADCYNLPSFTIPENVTTISTGAFYRASIPTDVTDVSDYLVMGKKLNMDATAFAAFINNAAGETIVDFSEILNNRLSQVSLPSTIGEIGVGAFRKCAQLSEIIVPASVATIRSLAFSETDIKRVQLCRNNTTIGGPYAGTVFDEDNEIDFIVPSKASYSTLTAVENFTVAERHARTLTEGKFGTLCLGYDAKLPDNITLYEVTEAKYDEEDANVLKSIVIDEVDTDGEDFYIAAGKPYFFLASADGSADFEPVATFACTNTAGEANGLHGALESTGVTAGVLMLKDNKLYPAQSGSTCAAFRAWLVDSEIQNSPNAPSRRAVRFNFDDGATGIISVRTACGNNGDSSVFDLSGRRVNGETARKGVYIMGGKKVLR